MNASDSNARMKSQNAAGFTMIEAVIAMLVTVVGLVSIAGMFGLAMKTNASSRNFTTATTFAQDKLEPCPERHSASQNARMTRGSRAALNMTLRQATGRTFLTE